MLTPSVVATPGCHRRRSRSNAAVTRFVPLVSAAASTDAVRRVALTEITFNELDKIQKSHRCPGMFR